jgi:hypothetical protein
MLDIVSLAACEWPLMYNRTENLRLPINDSEQSLAFDMLAPCEVFICYVIGYSRKGKSRV